MWTVDVRIRGARYYDVFPSLEAAQRWADDLWACFGGSFFHGDTKEVNQSSCKV